MNTNENNFHTSSSSSTSSSEEDESNVTSLLKHHQTLVFAYTNQMNAMAYYMNNVVNGHLNEGSTSVRRVIYRDRVAADKRLRDDYFVEHPRYNEELFRRRFRMSRHLFLRIVSALENHSDYFVQKNDACGIPGLSSLQKITAAFRILSYGVPADSTDEYIKIGKSIAIESTKKLCHSIVEVFGQRYLRAPNANDVARLLKIGEKRGFPGMLGSLDCMHWKWKSCPTAWVGQYSGRSGSPTIILEAVADYDLWIWHAHFGLPGSNNDINVLEASDLFANLTEGKSPPACYKIREKEYEHGYYLADGIYPKWSTLVQSIRDPCGPKKQLFAKMQEAYRKDVERAFGVLQSRFAIIKGSARFWKKSTLHYIMTACIIMHNMIIEDERDTEATITHWKEAPVPEVEMVNDDNLKVKNFLARHKQIRDKDAHFELRNALIEHLWERYGNLGMEDNIVV